MDKPETPRSKELPCVGKLEIVRPKPVGFLCGSIPVPTDKAFHGFDSALIPSEQTVQAPRYRMIPTETDLNMLPLLSSIPDKVLPLTCGQAKTNADLPWENGTIASNLTRKGEALAVSGLVEYGDEIDVIAPTDILKQLFKMPYSRAQLSIAVHRVGQTLVLNTGPDVEEGEKLVRRRNNQAKCADKSLFLNFAMHSVRMEACDCPPDHHTTSKETSASCIFPGQFGSREEPVEAPQDCDRIAQDKGLNRHGEYSQTKQGDFFWEKKKNKKNRSPNAVKKVSKAKEKPRCSMQESDKFRRVNNDGFLRVLFWQFHNFRMLLGSDLLILSNEKYVAVSLHLWDVSRQVTPLTWLEAWLDNVMASVPELAICYHQDGVVQGYELLKTEDIFLLKGVSEDGTPAFHPHVVQQNGLMVLRFLQENCKQDPGAYWLHKSPGEDVIQLFDLSVMPKKRSTDDCDDTRSVLPSLIHRGRSDSLLSLGTLLYRIAHRLSLSMSPEKRARCVRFFRQCLDFLDEPDHLVVRAFAHEQFARLLLTYDEGVDLTSEVLPTDSEVIVTDAEEDSFEVLAGNYETTSCDVVTDVPEVEPGNDDETIKDSAKRTSDRNLASRTVAVSSEPPVVDAVDVPSSGGQSFSVCDSLKSVGYVGQNISDPVCSKLTAVHHVSQAIKSLRWKRQLQCTESNRPLRSTESNLPHTSRIKDELHSPLDFSICACGDVDCIEVCDIREWLPTSKLDDKSWKLVLLLGESYLALGQAYKDDGQLFQALKVMELACLVYGSMPQHYEDKRYISSMVCTSPTQVEVIGRCDKSRSLTGDDCLAINQSSSNFLFWVKAWTLVGDVYVEFHLIKGKENPLQSEKNSFTKEVKMSSEVFKEVERLRNKLGQFSQNCSSCSLRNCSCQSDRASSGNSASSSSGDAHPLASGRKKGKRSSARGSSYSHPGSNEDDRVHLQEQNKLPSESRDLKHSRNDVSREMSSMKTDSAVEKQFEASEADGAPNINVKMNDRGGLGNHSETLLKEKTQVRNGGIFKYVRNPVIGDGDYNLIVAINCYEEAYKALDQSPSSSGEIQSVTRKKGWACNELGRRRLERRDLDEAETAFADAISAFKEVSDYTNIVLINCNLGHGRRACAEEMVAKLETFKKLSIFQNAYRHALENAKLEYSESLRYYGAAKMELNSISEGADSVSSTLRDEVCTQFAHTYLRLGMFLARENTVAEVYENGILEDNTTPIVSRSKREHRNHEISANEAIREALSMYESLGELRNQEAAYAYFQLACYQRDCCLKFLESDLKKNNISRGENQRVKQYASLADRNWQKSMDFYGSGTHPVMYLTILIERASFSLSLSSSLHSTMLLESALTHLLEGRHISDNKSLYIDNPEICAKFWSELQTLLKKMLSLTLSTTNTQKSVANSQQPSMKKSGDVAKLRELYKMSLKSTEFSQLHAMHSLWTTS